MNQNRTKFEKSARKSDFKQASGGQFRGSGPMEVVMFNMSSFSEWEKGVVNRNYHIFRSLAGREEVGRIIAVDFLPFTFKRVLRNYWENIIKSAKCKVKNEKHKITNIYRDLTTKCIKIDGYPAELYVFSTIDSIFSHQRVIDKLNKVLKKIDQLPDYPITQLPNYPITRLPRLVWSYFPMFVDYFNKIPRDLTVFDAVDNWTEHPSFARYRKLLEANYRIIGEKSDLIFTVAPTLCDFFKDLGREKDCYFIPLGVDVEHFQRSDLSRRPDIKDIPRPIIGYIGTIQNRVDLDLVEYLIKKNLDKSFVFIGPIWPAYLKRTKSLKKYKNVYLLGRKPYSQAPAYIKNFDVAIIPHYVDAFMKYTGSLKLLEYLACGRPVVSTPASGVERFLPLVYVARDSEDFNKKIDQALKDDTIELRDRRVERARSQDWKLQVGKMMEIIKNKKPKIKNKKYKHKNVKILWEG